MTILLAGDTGGTKTILRLVRADANGSHQEILLEETYASKEFPDLVPIVKKFLTGATEKPIRACFGIAGPIVNNTSKLTNLSWSLDAQSLEKDLELEKVTLINDFAAISYGILGLASEDIYTLQAGERNANAPIGVIGAGTGLGEGFLLPIGNGNYRVFPSEGGHADFPPRSTTEFELLNYLLDKLNIDRVSVERVVSGMGIASIYEFLRDKESNQESPAMKEIFQQWRQEIGKEHKTIDLSAEISKKAQTQEDYLCQQAMKIFIEAYGAEAGNIALKLLPFGGIYIAGGIAPKNLNLLKQGNFLEAFANKGRFSTMMKKFPVHVILNPKVGLIGAALCAANI